MTQDERSERSRGMILEAALALFSRQGFGATSIRDIAAKADVSTGSVYHHFKDKEELFETLLKDFQGVVQSPEFPLTRLLQEGVFPDRLQEIGLCCRELVARYRCYVALIHVDVVEFEGRHVREFFDAMGTMCERFITEHGQRLRIAERLRPGVPAAAAMLMTFRVFVYYAVVELLFGVPNHYGMSSEDSIRVVSEILQRGMIAGES